MIDVDLSEFERFERALRLFASKGVPHAARQGLNDGAFILRREWQEQIRKAFTLRNQYTERGVRVDKARGTNLRQLEAEVGHIAPYMAIQETGGVDKADRKYKPIATRHARRGGSDEKQVKAGARLGRINVYRNKVSGGGRRRRNIAAMRAAKKRGEKHVLLGRRRGGVGMFRLMGTMKKLRTKMLYDLSRRSVQIKPEPTLQRALEVSEKPIKKAMLRAMIKQLRFHKVSGF